MNGYKLNIYYSEPYNEWITIDEDYDGTPDSSERMKLLGTGKTPSESVNDFFERLSEIEEYK